MSDVRSCITFEFRGQAYTRSFHGIRNFIHRPDGAVEFSGVEQDDNEYRMFCFAPRAWTMFHIATGKVCRYCEDDE